MLVWGRFQFVTQQSKLVVLPCEYPVSRILSMFVEEQGGKAGEDTDELQVWQEVAAGVQSYFERSLGTILLYVATGCSPSRRTCSMDDA